MNEAILLHPVEALLALPFLIMGLSHVVQPAMWREFFTTMKETGTQAVIRRTFSLELWPAAVIVVFHREWSWPGIILTAYGYALMAKITLSLLIPEIGLRSLQMAETHGDRGFRVAGVVLLALFGYCAARIVLAA